MNRSMIGFNELQPPQLIGQSNKLLTSRFDVYFTLGIA